MATLSELLRGRTDLPDHDVEWLHLLVGDWQLVADLSFADLVLWVRSTGDRWEAVAHVRPTTGQLVFVDDQVGRVADRGPMSELVEESATEQRILRVRQAKVERPGLPDQSVREEYIPVVRQGRVVAVMTRHTNLWTTRTPSRLELTYLATADALCRMVTGGEFPHGSAPTGLRRGAPRVGDGVIRLDVDGIVTYASPTRSPPCTGSATTGRSRGRASRRSSPTTCASPTPSTRACRSSSPAVSRGAPRSWQGARRSRCGRSRSPRRASVSGRSCCSGTSASCGAGSAS